MDNLPLEAGDDAGVVKWVDISEKIKLYASHRYFIKLVTEKRGAHWSEDPGPECWEWCKWGTKGRICFPALTQMTSFSVEIQWKYHAIQLAKTLGSDRGFFRDFALLLLISQLLWNEMNVELLLCFGFLSSLFAAISYLQTCVTALGFCLVVVQRLFTSALYFCTDFSSGVWILKGSESCRMIAWIMT